LYASERLQTHHLAHISHPDSPWFTRGSVLIKKNELCTCIWRMDGLLEGGSDSNYILSLTPSPL
jgi:hypothetical protein